MASEILLGEIFMGMLFMNDSSPYVEQVAAYQEALDQLVLDAKAIPIPKDSTSQEIYQIYLHLVTERSMTFQTLLDAMMTMDIGEMFGLSMSVSSNFNEEWAQFESLWIAYMAE